MDRIVGLGTLFTKRPLTTASVSSFCMNYSLIVRYVYIVGTLFVRPINYNYLVNLVLFIQQTDLFMLFEIPCSDCTFLLVFSKNYSEHEQ
jgi:hypothetical protein